MDPATAVQLISAIVDLAFTIYAYGSAVKQASADIRQLQSELFGLKAAFEHIAWLVDGRTLAFTNGHSKIELRDALSKQDAYVDVAPSLLECDETVRALVEAQALLEQLHKLVGKPRDSRGARIFQRASWPLRRSETLKYTQQLERLKTYFILATTSDNVYSCQQILSEVRALRTDFVQQQAVADDRALRLATRKWLSPCKPQVTLKSALTDHQTGTGRWFLDGSLKQ